jgi:DNA mismatch endonuclease (patch repair protein)
MGFRFTVNGPKNKLLPGRPDIVLVRYQTVVFVHGCFWHRHRGCANTPMPKTRCDYWQKKFAANVRRDRANRRKLRQAGWKVIVLWECEIGEADTLAALLSRIKRNRGFTAASSPLG